VSSTIRMSRRVEHVPTAARTDGLYTEFMPEWDAARYHRVSDPQLSWGLRVLDRLRPQPGERILDIGCGTGRLIGDLLARASAARVTGIDRSWPMIAEANGHFGGRAQFVQAEATRLPFPSAFAAVFSTATFHWVPDHARLFSEIHRVLEPGGRLVSQAGGGPNLSRLYDRTAALARTAEYAPYFAGWADPWTFAGVDDTIDRLERAGFSHVSVWLESAPTSFPDPGAYSEFVATVCLRYQLDRLPDEERQQYVARLTEMAADDEPRFTLDYWRLNIDARKL
jgi:trans-aconitate methyltransferase